jgi:hypothetical protein
MWKANSRGLVDRGGHAWFTLTPVRQMWIFDMFFPKGFNPKKLPEQFQALNRWAIRGSMYDNPYISEEGIKEFEADLKPWEKKCRIDGLPLEFAGLIYSEFDTERHVLQKVPEGWTAYNSPPPTWPIYVAIDPHPQTPHAVLFATVSPLGQVFFYDEIFLQCQIDELCGMINDRLIGRHCVFTLCDPSAWINNPVTGRTVADEFLRHRVLVDARKNSRRSTAFTFPRISQSSPLKFCGMSGTRRRMSRWTRTITSWNVCIGSFSRI